MAVLRSGGGGTPLLGSLNARMGAFNSHSEPATDILKFKEESKSTPSNGGGDGGLAAAAAAVHVRAQTAAARRRSIDGMI